MAPDTDHNPGHSTIAFIRSIATSLARVLPALVPLLLVSACYRGPNVAPSAQIEFRAAQRAPFPDGVEREWPAGEPIYLERTATIVATDLHRVDPSLGDFDQPILSVKLTPEGTAKMEQLSKRQEGKLVAILIHDEIVTAPVVVGPISERLIIDGAWTVDELNEIVAGIRLTQ